MSSVYENLSGFFSTRMRHVVDLDEIRRDLASALHADLKKTTISGCRHSFNGDPAPCSVTAAGESLGSE